MHLAFGDVEVDAVECDDLAEGFADRPCANCKGRRSAETPADRRVAMLPSCRAETRQFVSELGM
jgi:hypothetical protein